MHLRDAAALTYFIGQILSLLCCAVICSLALSFARVSATKAQLSPAIRHESLNGIAAVTYRGDLRKTFVFSANLNLPERINNQSWYSVWLMVAELKGTDPHPSILQVGLMRWDQSKFQMQPFITTEQAGKELMFKPVAGILTGYHRFAIAGDSSTIELRMDSKVLMSAPRAEFFKDDTPIYVDMAAEVFAVGDTISGLVNDVTLVSGGGHRETPPISHAAFEDRGLKFLCSGDGQWEATGRFDPKVPRFVQYLPPQCR
jgi:hypothetical protein